MTPVSIRGWFFITIVCIVVLGMLIFGYQFLKPENIHLIISLIIIVFILDLLAVDLSKDTEITMSQAAIFASSLYLQPSVIIWIAFLAIFLSDIIKKKNWYKSMFNASNIALSAFLCSLVFHMLTGGTADFDSISTLIPAFVGGSVYFSINALLLGLVIALSYDFPLKDVINSQILKKDQVIGMFLSLVIGYAGLVVSEYNIVLVAIMIPFIYGIFTLFKRGHEVEQESMVAMKMAATTLDLRDPSYTGLHSKRVRDYAIAIAEALDLPKSMKESIENAALVHDLGKIGIPDDILKKPEPLSTEDWIIMKEHPVEGFKLLNPLSKYKEEAKLVLYHHERWDGKGYPNGLIGEATPKGARILAIADSLDSMLSDRPYRKKLTILQVITELKKESGEQFEPTLSLKAIELLENKTIP